MVAVAYRVAGAASYGIARLRRAPAGRSGQCHDWTAPEGNRAREPVSVLSGAKHTLCKASSWRQREAIVTQSS
jgi:hypothetical protein